MSNNNTSPSRRLARLLPLLCLLATGAHAQEPPAPPPPPAVTAPTETAAPVDAAPAAVPAEAQPVVTAPVMAAPAAPADTRKTLLILPPEFEVSQRSAGGVVEAVPEWSNTARTNITQALNGIFAKHTSFRAMPMPALAPEEAAVLREHTELFKLLALDTYEMLNAWSKAWKKGTDRKAYTIGNGLKFLAERSGADYAVFVNGAQITQSGGSIFMQFALAGLGVSVPGGGTFLTFGVVDLKDGSVEWFDVRLGGEALGITGTDMRTPATADKVLNALFGKYPKSPLIDDIDPAGPAPAASPPAASPAASPTTEPVAPADTPATSPPAPAATASGGR